ncbi:DUF3311 domain-containing protein [Amycolatopsis sp. NPDC051903]|uniref:DUF3311 domain-containing protein n=1 Tax=Amycolatopsis sp. NPDC051903 TaxID=3363936 RepID=UPI0037BC82D3
MKGSVASPLIGLGVPAVALIVVLPAIGNTAITVFGIPLLFFWIFLWIPLTSLCLWLSWHFFDRHRPDEDEPATPAEPDRRSA